MTMTHIVQGGSHVTRHVHVCGFRFHGLGRLTHDGDTHGLGRLSHDLCRHEFICVIVCTNKYVAWSHITSDVLIHELIRICQENKYFSLPRLVCSFFNFRFPRFFSVKQIVDSVEGDFSAYTCAALFSTLRYEKRPTRDLWSEKRPVKETCASDKRSYKCPFVWGDACGALFER